MLNNNNSQNSNEIEIVACHHENGSIQQIKFSDGSVVSMKEAVEIAKTGRVKNFTVSHDNRSGKDVLRGKRESLPNTRLYDLPRF